MALLVRCAKMGPRSACAGLRAGGQKLLYNLVMKLRAMLLLAAVALVQAQKRGEHWVATWGTAQMLVRPAAPATPPSTTAPAAAPTPQSIASRGFDNQTVRMIVRTSIGGRRVRVGLSNAFGSAPVQVGAAHIALRTKDSEIDPKSD